MTGAGVEISGVELGWVSTNCSFSTNGRSVVGRSWRGPRSRRPLRPRRFRGSRCSVPCSTTAFSWIFWTATCGFSRSTRSGLGCWVFCWRGSWVRCGRSAWLVRSIGFVRSLRSLRLRLRLRLRLLSRGLLCSRTSGFGSSVLVSAPNQFLMRVNSDTSFSTFSWLIGAGAAGVMPLTAATCLTLFTSGEAWLWISSSVGISTIW